MTKSKRWLELLWPIGKIPIFHVASLARSGETMLLRCLSQHSRLQVVHNLSAQDSADELKLFEFLQSYEPTRISSRHPLVRPYKLKRRQALVLKQAVWKHAFNFEGIVLARQPVACFASLKAYDSRHNGLSWQENWHINQERLTRWLKQMEPDALEGFESLPPLRQFARFYSIRIRQLLATGKPVVRYEDLVSSPLATLTRVCNHFQIDFEPAMLQSHEAFRGHIGHGQNELDRPINTDSLFKYTNEISRHDFNVLTRLCGDEIEKLEYALSWGSSGVPAIDSEHGKAA